MSKLEAAAWLLETLNKPKPTAPPLSPLEWARQYATIVHPVRGRIPFVPYDYQAEFLKGCHSPRRIVLKARQIGYSQVFALEALYFALHYPEATILLVSRSQDLAVNLLRYCYQAYNGLGEALELVKQNESEMGFSNGARIKSIPANRSTGRGFAASRVYLDEFAYAEYADDIYQSVSPALSQGGALTIASTPNGMGNLFHRLWVGADNFVKQMIDWRQCPTYWTPADRAAGIEAEQCAWYLANRPNYTNVAWASEFDCDFATSGGQVFRRVRECLCPVNPREHDGHAIVLGVDFAQANDYTAISVMCADCRQQLEVDRFNRVPWEVVRSRVRIVFERWQAAAIVAEHNSIGGPNIEALQNEHLPVIAFETTTISKPPLIQSLVLALERGEIGLVDYLPQTLELEAYQMQPSRLTGRPTYAAPEGAHDDTVMALALSWLACLEPKSGVRVTYDPVRIGQY